MARSTTRPQRPTPKTEPLPPPAPRKPGDITIKIQRRTNVILERILDHLSKRMMKAQGAGGCEECSADAFRVRICKTEVLHCAVRDYAHKQGVPIS